MIVFPRRGGWSIRPYMTANTTDSLHTPGPQGVSTARQEGDTAPDTTLGQHDGAFTYLSQIDSPNDLRRLAVDRLPEVCDELRRFIIRELSVNPGHLASSLGVVELTVALHYVYDTPEDRLVWDVGHQAYGHKILTGRRDRFHTNRKLGGLGPFPSPAESTYDTFTCGHASNSISAALGMAIAAHLTGNPRKVVAIIGDGAMSGGLAFEGINNAGTTPNDMLIVLNDNNMSIDKSVGGMRDYLVRLNTNATYNSLRYKLARRLSTWGLLNDRRRKGLIRFSNSLKSILTKQQNIFEGMDIRYFGPVDGHNVVELVRVLRSIKDMTGPKLLHVHTTKGKGYEPAEKDATLWHAPGRFDEDTGRRLGEQSVAPCPPRFQDVFGETLLELARQNPRIVGVTPAMPTGCSLNIMMSELPERTFDVGIAEGHAVTFSAGMAKDGLLPFCNIYSAFAQRAVDNIIHDAAIAHLHMVLCLDRAGLVGEDGITHHGAFDLALLRSVPGITIASPYDECELRCLMYTAALPGQGLFVIRYPRGHGSRADWRCPLEPLPVGKGRCLREGTDVAVLTLGPIGTEAAEAISQLSAEGSPLSVAHYDMRYLKPLDTELLRRVGQTFPHIITVEDGVRDGGFGSAVTEFIQDEHLPAQVHRIGLPDRFVPHGTVAQLRHLCLIDAAAIKHTIQSL